MKKLAIMFVMLLGSVATIQAQSNTTFDFSCAPPTQEFSTVDTQLLVDADFNQSNDVAFDFVYQIVTGPTVGNYPPSGVVFRIGVRPNGNVLRYEYLASNTGLYLNYPTVQEALDVALAAIALVTPYVAPEPIDSSYDAVSGELIINSEMAVVDTDWDNEYRIQNTNSLVYFSDDADYIAIEVLSNGMFYVEDNTTVDSWELPGGVATVTVDLEGLDALIPTSTTR